MRKILFRGKNPETGVWAYGFYAGLRPRLNPEKVIHMIQPVNDNGTGGALVKVDPETVGQFTGLCDKNGKEIYEGDIVTSESFGDPFAVEFVENEYWGAFCAIEGGRENGSCYPLSEFSTGTGLLSCEVIGNIHDNPVLMEGSEDGR